MTDAGAEIDDRGRGSGVELDNPTEEQVGAAVTSQLVESVRDAWNQAFALVVDRPLNV